MATKEIDLMEVIHVLWNKILFIVSLCIIGGILAGYITLNYLTPQYTASVSMYVYNAEEGKQTTINDINVAAKLVNTYIVILKSNTVLEIVANESGLNYTASQLKKMVNATTVDSTEVIKVNVISENPDHARIIAETIKKIAPEEIIRVVKAGSVEIIDSPEQNSPQTSPNLMNNIMLGVFMGGFISVSITIISWMRDKTIKNESELVEKFGYPLLGAIPGFEKNFKGGKYGKEYGI